METLIFLQASKTIDFEVLRGLTNSLLAAKKPDEVGQYADRYRHLQMLFCHSIASIKFLLSIFITINQYIFPSN